MNIWTLISPKYLWDFFFGLFYFIFLGKKRNYSMQYGMNCNRVSTDKQKMLLIFFKHLILDAIQVCM